MGANVAPVWSHTNPRMKVLVISDRFCRLQGKPGSRMLNSLLSRYHEIRSGYAIGKPHLKGIATGHAGCEHLIFPQLPSPSVAKTISTALTVGKNEDWGLAASRLLTIAGIEATQAEVTSLLERLSEQNIQAVCNTEKRNQVLRLDITDPVVQRAILRNQ